MNSKNFQSNHHFQTSLHRLLGHVKLREGESYFFPLCYHSIPATLLFWQSSLSSHFHRGFSKLLDGTEGHEGILGYKVTQSPVDKSPYPLSHKAMSPGRTNWTIQFYTWFIHPGTNSVSRRQDRLLPFLRLSWACKMLISFFIYDQVLLHVHLHFIFCWSLQKLDHKPSTRWSSPDHTLFLP